MNASVADLSGDLKACAGALRNDGENNVAFVARFGIDSDSSRLCQLFPCSDLSSEKPGLRAMSRDPTE